MATKFGEYEEKIGSRT